MLEGISGEERISRRSVYRISSEVSEPSSPVNLENNLSTIFEPLTTTSRDSFEEQLPPDRKVTFEDEQLLPSLSHDVGELHHVERMTNPLDTPKDVAVAQESSIVDSLMGKENNVNIDMIGLEHTNDSTDSSAGTTGKTPAWTEMFSATNPVQKCDTPKDPSPPLNRFCIKSPPTTNPNPTSHTNQLPGENTIFVSSKPFAPIGKLTSPFSKLKEEKLEKELEKPFVNTDTQPLLSDTTDVSPPSKNDPHTVLSF